MNRGTNDKRHYERPCMTVYDLLPRTQLLQTSGGAPAGINPMDAPEDI